MTPVFFTDRDLGKAFPGLLRERGILVERHMDHFAHDASDVEWLTMIGERGWMALTHDKRIRYKPNERDAVMRAGVGLFVLVGTTPTLELAENFVNSIEKVTAFLDEHSPPFIAKIHRPPTRRRGTRTPGGAVSEWLSYTQWLERHP